MHHTNCAKYGNVYADCTCAEIQKAEECEIIRQHTLVLKESMVVPVEKPMFLCFTTTDNRDVIVNKAHIVTVYVYREYYIIVVNSRNEDGENDHYKLSIENGENLKKILLD